MGGLLRCDGCGSIRWDVLGLERGTPECTTCGQPLKPERRRPGRRRPARKFQRAVDGERRGIAPTPPAA